MRNCLFEHVTRARRLIWRTVVATLSFARQVYDPCRGIVRILFEVVQVLRHVRLTRPRCADGIAGLAVLADEACIDVGLQACELLCCARAGTDEGIAAADCPGLMCGAARGPEDKGCGD